MINRKTTVRMRKDYVYFTVKRITAWLYDRRADYD